MPRAQKPLRVAHAQLPAAQHVTVEAEDAVELLVDAAQDGVVLRQRVRVYLRPSYERGQTKVLREWVCA